MGGGAAAPAQFGGGDWSIADRQRAFVARITVTSLPSDGGSAIIDLQYQVDGGSWTSLGGTSTGTYDIAGLTYNVAVAVAIRAVNAVGNGTASATKSVTPTYDPEVALGAKLAAWWTADAGITLSTNTVTAWVDQVAGYATTPAGSPQYGATTFNGSPGVIFDGTDDTFTCIDAGLMAALPDGAEVGEIWSIVQQDALAADTTTRYAANYGAGANVARRQGRVVVSAQNRARTQTGSGAASSSATDVTVALSSRHVIRSEIGATASEVSVDNATPVSQAVVPSTTNTRLRIGASDATTAINFWQGKIRDVLLTIGALTTDEEAALWAWALPRRNL